jgi:hypothetical protein
MSDEATSKEAFFQTLSKLDSDDEQIIDEGRLTSEAFLTKSSKGLSRMGSSALHGRGSSRNASMASLREVGRANPSNTTDHPLSAQKVQRTISTPIFATSLGSTGTNDHDIARKAQVSAQITPNHSIAPVPLRHTTSAPIRISAPSAMPSYPAPRTSGKRKRCDVAPQMPENQRIFRDLLFCTVEDEKSGDCTDND